MNPYQYTSAPPGPFNLRLAAERVAIDPTATDPCGDDPRHGYYPLLGPSGIPAYVCPICGTALNESVCEGALRFFLVKYGSAEDRAAKAEEAKMEAEPAPARGNPPGLDDVIGNPLAVLQIRTALDAHHARGGKEHFPHILLVAPGGTGKTMLSEIIAREIKRPIRLAMGQSLNSPARVADMLLSLKAGDVLFVDELAGMKGQCQETLYRAMEDGILVPIGKAGKPIEKPKRLPPFTLIGATTDEWALLPSLIQRFKYRIRLERMTAPELAQAMSDRAKRRGWELTADAAQTIAERAHGTPRLAIGLLDGCRDTALAQGGTAIDAGIVAMTCQIWGLDGLGLDKIARRYLDALAAGKGEPVRVNVVSSKLDCLSRRTLEMRIEPDLVFLGLIEKRPDGRILTAAGRAHLKS